MVILVGVVAKHRHRLAERRPDVVEVHAGGHDAHDDLERGRLGDLDLLELEGVDGWPSRSWRMTHAVIVGGSSPGSVSMLEI